MHMEDLHEQWRLSQARAEFTGPSSGEIITIGTVTNAATQTYLCRFHFQSEVFATCKF